MNKFHQYFFSILFLICLPIAVAAAVPQWTIIPSESQLKFTGTQNNAPVSGEFKKFSGEIQFDPNNLKESHVTITVDVGSLTTSFADLTNTLITADWFDTKLFPQAVFKADEFSKLNDNTYQAKGTLTIRGKTVPILLTFMQTESKDNKVKVAGNTMLKRNMFGIGQGEWADTKEVKDDVKVEFVLTAQKK